MNKAAEFIINNDITPPFELMDELENNNLGYWYESGGGAGWIWNKNSIKDYDEIFLWEYAAKCMLHWTNMYKDIVKNVKKGVTNGENKN